MCNLQALANQGVFFISVNQVLAFARAGKDYLLCFILASRDVGKSCISLLATVQVIMVMPPRAQGRSTPQSSPPFIDQTVLGVLSLSLSRGPSFPLRTTRSAVDWGLENAGFESKTSTAVNQQPQRANTSTATQLLRVKISAQMLTIRQLIQDTVQQSRNSATINQTITAALQGGCERFSSLSRIKRSPPGSTATFADRACAPWKSASPRLAFPRHPGAVHQGNTEW